MNIGIGIFEWKVQHVQNRCDPTTFHRSVQFSLEKWVPAIFTQHHMDLELIVITHVNKYSTTPHHSEQLIHPTPTQISSEPKQPSFVAQIATARPPLDHIVTIQPTCPADFYSPLSDGLISGSNKRRSSCPEFESLGQIKLTRSGKQRATGTFAGGMGNPVGIARDRQAEKWISVEIVPATVSAPTTGIHDGRDRESGQGLHE